MSNKLGSKYGTGKRCKKLSVADAAYIAGFVDGEGCIGVYRRLARKGRSTRQRIVLHISIGNTHVGVLDWIEEVTGLGRASDGIQKNPKDKRAYFWQCGAAGAASLVRQLVPFLKVKIAQAELLLSVHDVMMGDRDERGRVGPVARDLAWQEEIRGEFGKLNARGRVEQRAARA